MSKPEYYYEKDEEPKEKGFWHLLPWVVLTAIVMTCIVWAIITLVYS